MITLLFVERENKKQIQKAFIEEWMCTSGTKYPFE
jgi:hypothetical protein